MTRIGVISILVVFASAPLAPAAAQTLLWTRQFGTTAVDHGNDVAVDGAGKAYICGSTEGSLGGPSAGGSDAFLIKYGDSCYADCDQSTGVGVLDIFDFLCFQNAFVGGCS